MYRSKGLRILSLVLAIVFAVAMFSGCGAKPAEVKETPKEAAKTPAATAAAKPGDSKPAPYQLKWYTCGSVQPDPQPVYDEMNKILKEKINATLEVVTFDWGQYNDKLKILMASSDPFDLCFTSSWTNDYSSAVSKGAYVALDELLEKSGKSVKSTVPAKYWDAVKINGKIYGIPNYQIFATVKGVDAKKELVEKYKFDPKSVKKMADLEPFLEAVKKGEPNIVPYLPDHFTPMPYFDVNTGFVFDPLLGQQYPLYINAKANDYKVINVYETKEAMEFYKLMRSWYQKGYIRKDAASLKDLRAEQKSGKYAVFAAGALKPGNEVDTEAFTGFPVVDMQTAAAYISTSGITATLTAISKTSKNPERAMMFYDLMFSDKQLYNLMCFGIEGKHYKKISEDTVEAVANSSYNPSTDWEFGNQFNAFYRKGQKPGIWEETKKLNESAAPSPLLGFAYNKETMKTENAQIDAIVGQYLAGLITGTLDPEKALPEMNDKLKKAGLDKVIADAQKQIDDWRKANGK